MEFLLQRSVQCILQRLHTVTQNIAQCKLDCNGRNTGVVGTQVALTDAKSKSSFFFLRLTQQLVLQRFSPPQDILHSAMFRTNLSLHRSCRCMKHCNV